MIEQISKPKAASLGLQHVLAMYAGAMLVPILVGGAIGLNSTQLAYLIAIDLVTCGIATLLQMWKNRFFGIGLPVVLGSSFVAVTPMIAIGTNYGMTAIYGAIIAAGLFIILCAKFFSKILKLFPPVVTGTVVMIIGLSLIPTGVKNMAGGASSPGFGSLENLIFSIGTLFVILLVQYFGKGYVKSLAVLIGIIAGTISYGFVNPIDFTTVGNASWFHLPAPFYFGVPTFEIGPIITMMIVGIVVMIESTGVFLALSDITKQKLSPKDMERGYRAEGIAFLLGGIFNAFPYNTFAQNVGLVQMSGVKSKNVTVAAGLILVCLGLIPKIAALATLIPTAVLGGATVVMFGMIVSSGIKMLSTVDFTNQNNLLVIACSVSLGLGATVVPELFSSLPAALKMLVGDGLITGSLTAIFLNLVLSLKHSKKEKVKVPETSLVSQGGN
ncbi:nucleobase:cation symporter-2 family protein [Lysinibacillus fusiformis]|nr:nucleobase:cation symporter-2 family protein [Lysinibacillus fusiformis]